MKSLPAKVRIFMRAVQSSSSWYADATRQAFWSATIALRPREGYCGASYVLEALEYDEVDQQPQTSRRIVDRRVRVQVDHDGLIPDRRSSGCPRCRHLTALHHRLRGRGDRPVRFPSLPSHGWCARASLVVEVASEVGGLDRRAPCSWLAVATAACLLVGGSTESLRTARGLQLLGTPRHCLLCASLTRGASRTRSLTAARLSTPVRTRCCWDYKRPTLPLRELRERCEGLTQGTHFS